MGVISDTEAEASLTQLLYRAAGGEEIVIEKDGHPIARLVQLQERPKRSGPRPLGLLKGQVWVGPDFDDPLPEEMMRAFE
jgi:antitoxin (DNA-binding transcriptional repressor) of toxin-antitoxin stability system